MDLGKQKTDPEAERNGTWVPVDLETEILVARLGNRYNLAVAVAITEAVGSSATPGERKAFISSEQGTKVVTEQLAEHVLLDWRGMKEDGEELPYSKEAAVRVLSDPKLHDFRDFVVRVASDATTFYESAIQAAAGN